MTARGGFNRKKEVRRRVKGSDWSQSIMRPPWKGRTSETVFGIYSRGAPI